MRTIIVTALFLSLAAGPACKRSKKEAIAPVAEPTTTEPAAASAPMETADKTIKPFVPEGWKRVEGVPAELAAKFQVLEHKDPEDPANHATVSIVRLDHDLLLRFMAQIESETCQGDESRPAEVRRTATTIEMRCYSTVTVNERGDQEEDVEIGVLRRPSETADFYLVFLGEWRMKHDATATAALNEIVSKTRLE